MCVLMLSEQKGVVGLSIRGKGALGVGMEPGEWNKFIWCQGRGSPGGGQGGQLPPNFLSQWDGYACAPP